MKKIRLIPSIILSLAAVVPLFAGAGHTHARHSSTTFESIKDHYEAIYESLVKDSIEGIAAHAKAISATASSITENFDASKAGVEQAQAERLLKILPEISKSATSLEASKDLDSARKAFGDLSRPLVQYRELYTGEKPNVAYCPMAKKPWLQEGEKIANPYYGTKMLRCGSIVSK